jgi:hypothetical protein
MREVVCAHLVRKHEKKWENTKGKKREEEERRWWP